MKTRRTPILTIGLLILVIALHNLVEDKSLLYFSATDISQGQIWRVISGHFMHSDTQHLLWNCLGLGVLGTLIEQTSRLMLWAALGVGIATVSGLLLMPFAQLQYYCGLSGVLNTLLLIALWLEWKRTRSWLMLLIACASFAKVVIEISMGTAILTHISWPPYAWSHAAGLLGGLILVGLVQQSFATIAGNPFFPIPKSAPQ